MLSIGKLAVGPDAGRYYIEQVAQGRADYYAGEGEAPGAWAGSGAAALSLAGEVDEGGLGRLLAAEDPASGEALRRPLAAAAVAGFDLTFSAPKSVGVLWGIADADEAREVRLGHEAAVDGARAYLEREACRARRGAGGAVKGSSIIAWSSHQRSKNSPNVSRPACSWRSSSGRQRRALRRFAWKSSASSTVSKLRRRFVPSTSLNRTV